MQEQMLSVGWFFIYGKILILAIIWNKQSFKYVYHRNESENSKLDSQLTFSITIPTEWRIKHNLPK